MPSHIWGNKKDHRLYETWRSMIKRCYSKNRKDYKWYGKRNITVCEEWKTDFWQFVKDMDSSYKKGLTLDRINNNGNYNYKNCKWSSWKEQINNQRKANITKRSSTKTVGVNKAGNKFIVRKTINKKRIHIGYADSLKDAINLLKEFGGKHA